MGRYLIQLIALLSVASVGTGIYWRVGTSQQAPAASTTPRFAAKQASNFGAIASSAAPIVSWPGSKSQYSGRYRLVSGNDQTVAQSGELTIFLRKNVPHEPKPVLSGILNLNGTDGTNVFYLTHFLHQGAKRWTRVNLGIFTGPVIGTFRVTSLAGDRMQAEILQQGQSPILLKFVRFSHSTTP